MSELERQCECEDEDGTLCERNAKRGSKFCSICIERGHESTLRGNNNQT
jgi:hypothetical protein